MASRGFVAALAASSLFSFFPPTILAVPVAPTASADAEASLSVSVGASLTIGGGASPSPTATIDIGVIRGVQTTLPNASAPVNKFLGVPFAASPPKRFMPPEPASKLDGILDVGKFKPACMQDFAYPLLGHILIQAVFNVPKPAESEDCLYLNVFAPSKPAPPEGYAVMFWLFGGGNVFGTASLDFYDGSAFAAYQDVIVVTTNYRTNSFGFANSPELTNDQQNAGLHDQHTALDWVRRNIHEFGGSKDRITVFGESAGGYNTDNLLLAYPENPPFQAAILQSGQQGFSALNQTRDRTQGWDQLVSHLNCDKADSPLACVQSKPGWRVRQVTQQQKLSFGPVADNVTSFADGSDRRRRGEFAKVPVLAGTNSEEGRVFAVGQSDWQEFLQKFVTAAPENWDAISQAYPESNYQSPYERISAAVTDLGFTCAQGLFLGQTVAAGVPAYGYVYNASFPNTAFSGTSGVWHSSEISIVFQTHADGPVTPKSLLPWGLIRTNLPATPRQRQLSQEMNKIWADFAKDPYNGPGWAAVKEDGSGEMRAFQQHASMTEFVTSDQVMRNCAMFMPVYCEMVPSTVACTPLNSNGLPAYK